MNRKLFCTQPSLGDEIGPATHLLPRALLDAHGVRDWMEDELLHLVLPQGL